MKKTYLFIIIAVVVVVIGWLAVSRTGQNPNTSSTTNTTTQPGQKTQQEAQSEKTPNFSLQDYNGKTVSLSDFAGKPLIINSWAAWCPFCREELPAFAVVQKEFGDKVVIIAIDRTESLTVAKGYTDQQGTTNSLIFLLDPSDSFYKSIGGFSMPETIFVDASSKTQFHKRGPMATDEIRERVQMLLGASGQDEKSTVPASSSAKELEPQENVVNYTGTQFSPQSMRVKSGTTVMFRNESGNSLWVASDPHPIHTHYSGFDSLKNIKAEETYSFTFTKTGTWGYHNHLNAGQKGEIIVE